MRGSGRIPLTLLAIGFAIFVAANCISASSQESSTNVGAKFFSAVLLAREAQIEGAQRETMQELAARLNVAVQLLEKADEAKNEGRLGSAQTLLSSAEELLEDILRAARAEKAAAVERASQLRTLTIVLVPVLSAIITVVTGYVLRYVRRRSVERLFKMLIVVKREDEKER